MAEFNIVHLSDLHIKGEYLSLTHTNLIKDIKNRTKNMKNVILVISGDIVDKGRYRVNGELNPVAVEFFQTLNDMLQDTICKKNHSPCSSSDGCEDNGADGKCLSWISKRVIDVQIVPGNHDKDISSDFVRNISGQFQSDPQFKGNEEEWVFEKRYFEDFIAFVNKVYSIFGLKKKIFRDKSVKKDDLQTSGNINSENKSLEYECSLFVGKNEIDGTTPKADDAHKTGITCKIDGAYKIDGTYKINETCGIEGICEIDGTCKINDTCKNDGPCKIDDTFGIDFIELPCLGIQIDKANGKDSTSSVYDRCNRCKGEYKCPDLTVCFIRVNTAWISNGGTEKHSLCIGQYQLKSLIDAYQKEYMKRCKKHEQILTICIAHHPLQNLKPEEEDAFKEMLLDKECLNADYYLCGHTHERMVSSLSNKGKKMTTLVTGIGWDHRDSLNDTGNDAFQKDTHSYSIHTFNEEKNILSTKMFRTNVHGEFEDDFSYYNTSAEKRLKKLSTPLYLEEYSFIELSHTGSTVNELFIDRVTLAAIKELNNSKNKFIKNCEALLKEYLLKRLQPDALKPLTEKIVETCKDTNSGISTDNSQKAIDCSKSLFSPKLDSFFITEIKKLDEKKRHEIFSAYLEESTLEFIRIYKKRFTDDIIRIVIRYHKDGIYYPFSGKTLPENALPDEKSPYTKTNYKWADGKKRYITARAFQDDTPKIFTLNKELVDFQVEHWEDFIVIIPKNFKYLYFKDSEDQLEHKEERPALSFVFSVRLNEKITEENNFLKNKKIFKELSNKLYLLEYTEIHKAITEVVDKFNKFFNINAESFVKFLDKIYSKKEGGDESIAADGKTEKDDTILEDDKGDKKQQHKQE